jgi:ribose transport system substrate-binding protein
MLSPIGMVDGGDVGFPKASRRASGARIAGPPSSSPLALSFGAALHQPTSAAPDAHRAAGSTPGTPGHKAGRNSASGQQDTAPEGLGLTVPLSAKPPSGKYLITLETPQPVSVQKNDAIAEAVALLGWKYERIQLGTDAEAGPRAFQDALERNPDMVHYSGTPAAAVQQQEAAEAQGVVAISDSNTEEVQPPLTSTSLDSTEQVEAWGEMSAATVVAASGEPTNVALVTIDAYPSLVAYTESSSRRWRSIARPARSRWSQQISDLGQTTPGAVVSTVQRNPDTEWVIFSFGDRALGVPAALRAANPQHQVRSAARRPARPTSRRCAVVTRRSGRPSRHRSSAGGSWTCPPGTSSVTTSRPRTRRCCPTQILTPDNIDDALFEEGIYVGVPDYQSEFKKLLLIE